LCATETALKSRRLIRTNKGGRKIDLGGGAEAAVIDSKGTGFVNLEESATVVSFDPKGLSVKQKWPITGCKTPTGLAMDTLAPGYSSGAVARYWR